MERHSTLDGHVTLSRVLAHRKHYPAIDILQSISRVMVDVVSEEHHDLAGDARKVLAVYSENEDLINIGAYVKGSSSEIDNSIERVPQLNQVLQQDLNADTSVLAADLERLKGIIGEEIPVPTPETDAG